MISSSAFSASITFSRREPSPIRPTRQILPLSGPSPAAISILNSRNNSARTFASSIPAGTALVVRRGELQTHRPHSGLERGCVDAMSPPSRFQPFLDDDPQRLVERVVHRDRRRMMVEPVGSPILLDQRNVEVP